MKKFTLIQENYDLIRFTISKDQFFTYRSTIERILLKELYPNRAVHAEGLTFLGPFNCEKSEGRDFSVFNKMNTNIVAMKYLVEQFKINTFEDLLKLIEDRKEEFFTENTKYFNEIRRLLKMTESYGDRNEYLSIDYIKSVIKSKLGIDVNPTKLPLGSYDDMINGIDIKFIVNGKTYTCQVKPLVKMIESGDEYIITSAGTTKNYSTSYLSFSNHLTGESILFQNKEVKINGSTIIIPKKYRVLA
jgi:hypothetical protein